MKQYSSGRDLYRVFNTRMNSNKFTGRKAKKMKSSKKDNQRKGSLIKIAFLCDNCNRYGTTKVNKKDIKNMEVRCPKCGYTDPDWMELHSK